MYTLALDTAADGISVAVFNNKDLLSQDYRMMERGQGEALIPMIQSVLNTAGLKMPQIGQVAVSVGPGSFTGVRIGLAAARGIGLALNIPVLGVSTLEAMTYQKKGKILAIIDTKRGDFYTQLFQDGHPLEDPITRSADQIAQMDASLLIGNGAPMPENLGSSFVETKDCPAVQVGLCAMTQARSPEPIYLREADVTCKRTN